MVRTFGGKEPGESSWLARRVGSLVETSEGQCWSQNRFPLSKNAVDKRVSSKHLIGKDLENLQS